MGHLGQRYCGVEQLVSSLGSYPEGRRFESCPRYKVKIMKSTFSISVDSDIEDQVIKLSETELPRGISKSAMAEILLDEAIKARKAKRTPKAIKKHA